MACRWWHVGCADINRLPPNTDHEIMQVAIVWFRNDLRLHDNITLQQAIKQNNKIIPVYILDTALTEGTVFGFPKMGAYRRQFVMQCVQDLQANLQKTGGDLIAAEGDTVALLETLCKQYTVTSLYYTRETAPEEIALEGVVCKAMQRLGVTVYSYHNSTLVDREALPFDVANMPDVFTNFRQQVERANILSMPIPPPDSVHVVDGIGEWQAPGMKPIAAIEAKIDARAAMHFTGGESAAKERVRQYFWEADGPRIYFETRNGLVGADYSTKLSPWLATGTLSARYVYEQVKLYEQERVANKSTYWILFELLWRDFFRLTMEKYGNKLFLPGGPKGKRPATTVDKAALQRWINGTTGEDFVNANMLELKHTGFMSNRGRQVVASYLVHDMKVNWLMGAAYFESMLVDYDVHSNYGNWAYVAGVGNDPRENRYFNIQKQAATYDPHAEYRKLWLQ